MPETTEQIKSCQLIGLAGILVQVVLGVLSFSVLVYKRTRERPRRAWRIWFMDTSKQGVSQLLAHGINVVISMMLSQHLHSDACIWYLATNILDNTLGVLICVGVLQLVESRLLSPDYPNLKSGNYYAVSFTYDDQPSLDIETSPDVHSFEISGRKATYTVNYVDWTVQFLIWNLIVVTSKTVVFCLEFWLSEPITTVATFLLSWIQPYKTLYLILAIIVVPVFMNALAFWIQDNFLMRKWATSQTTTNKGESEAETASTSDAPPVEPLL